MSPEIPRTLTAYRKIVGTVQVLLAQQRIDLPPLSALALALIGDREMLVREAIRLGHIPGSAPYSIVGKLHKAGFIRCGGNNLSRKFLTLALTPEGAKLAEDIRAALGGKVAAESVEAEQ
jgi:hypothetical protein